MKQIMIYVDDEEFEALEAVKQHHNMTWRTLILTLITSKNEVMQDDIRD